ncbi:endonuclease/exonuclease/phosphatase family protein [Kitasatospora sp. NPDC085879]|jgi:endonuclease/exonuclease/phosphatase family metal-dependent hydrolase|uniref:endonuclease/exonuclease/phosphatase family protein n=1 Tax=Kitasatospora sp. NPDC085879 TaxID=3154769 RepID=UPI00341D84BA
MLTVATWNVLHRVHAENWDSDVLDRWPEESARIAAVTARVAGLAERVVALQEVSGDQLASLHSALPASRSIRTLDYPRVPTPRRIPTRLADRSEHLVLLVDGPAEVVAAEAFADDPGKGLLAVRTAGLLVVATHVSTGPRRPGQLARLARVVAEAPERTAVLLGDFNADRTTVTAELGPGFAVAELPPAAPPTRPRETGAPKSQWIDHVVVHGIGGRGAVVDDVAGLSDHNPVRAEVG